MQPVRPTTRVLHNARENRYSGRDFALEFLKCFARHRARTPAFTCSRNIRAARKRLLPRLSPVRPDPIGGLEQKSRTFSRSRGAELLSRSRGNSMLTRGGRRSVEEAMIRSTSAHICFLQRSPIITRRPWFAEPASFACSNLRHLTSSAEREATLHRPAQLATRTRRTGVFATR